MHDLSLWGRNCYNMDGVGGILLFIDHAFYFVVRAELIVVAGALVSLKNLAVIAMRQRNIALEHGHYETVHFLELKKLNFYDLEKSVIFCTPILILQYSLLTYTRLHATNGSVFLLILG